MSRMSTAINSSLRCIVPGQDVLGESPLWCVPTQSLLWLDIDGGKLQRFHPATGRHDTFTFNAKYAGSLAMTSTPGRVLMGLDLGLFLFTMGTGELQLFCQVEPQERDNRLNDGRCDAHGRFWVGTMDNQLSRPNGSFYRVDPSGEVHHQFGDVIVSNTVAFSPQQDRLYFSDTRRFITWRFALNGPAGTISERQPFVDHSATKFRPDGACVDSEGFVWNAIFGSGRVVRYSPAGDVNTVIELPVTNPTCVALGGSDLKTLFITTARKFLSRSQLREEPLSGAVLAIDVEVPGIPEHCFPDAGKQPKRTAIES